MAKTFPLGRGLPPLLPLPAYFLVSISPATNSPKASPLRRLLISTPTQPSYPSSPRKRRGGSGVGRPRPETEARGARRPPPVSRARAGFGIAARRPPRWNSLGTGNPPGPGSLSPQRSSGLPRLPAAPGPAARAGVSGRPPGAVNKGAPGGNARSFPAARSAAGSPGPRPREPPPVPDARPPAGAARWARAACIPTPSPGASAPGERACPHLLANLFPSRSYRDLAGSAASAGDADSPSRSPGAAPAARRRRWAASPAGAGRGGGWAGPSAGCGPRARPPSPAQRAAPAGRGGLSPEARWRFPHAGTQEGRQRVRPRRAPGPVGCGRRQSSALFNRAIDPVVITEGTTGRMHVSLRGGICEPNESFVQRRRRFPDLWELRFDGVACSFFDNDFPL